MEALNYQQCAYCGLNTNGVKYCCRGCEQLAKNFSQTETEKKDFLDLESFKNQFQISSSNKYKLYVEGIHCASCVHLLERLPEFYASILQARVDFASSSLTIDVDSEFAPNALIELMRSWGYQAHFLKVDESSQTKTIKENKDLLRKLAITGACTGNIMLFVIPVYSGLEGSWKILFNWMSFVLFLPILLYSGVQFYQGAWNSLRYREVNVDFPITIALISSFLLSTFNLVRGSDEIYFDSTASFIFLILCSRYYLKRSQQNLFDQTYIANSIEEDQYCVLSNDTKKNISAPSILPDDVLLLNRGQTCPIDGVLLEPALIDLAIMNGEPMPRRFEAGMMMYAGSKLISENVQIKVTSIYQASGIYTLVENLRSGQLVKSPFTKITDKAAQWLIALVSVIALTYFVLNASANFQEAFNRALALIVLACPCALAFGAPLTFNLALRKAARMGLLIRDTVTIEKLWHIRHVFFDKTGTITSLKLKVARTHPDNITDDVKSVILGLEKLSSHPIAFAIRDFWPDQKPYPIDMLEEMIGIGVSGKYGDSYFEIKQNSKTQDQNEISVSVYQDKKIICSIDLETPIDPLAFQTVKKLRSNGITCYLASGDSQNKAIFVGERCGLSKQQIFGALDPVGKAHLLRSYPNTCMIGDGTNDAPAMQVADVGIAVKGSTYINFKSADVYFTHEGLKPVIDLFSIAQQTKMVLYRNFVFALAYNTIGGTLALVGYVNPWLAAVLMPISSALIVTSTLWGFK